MIRESGVSNVVGVILLLFLVMVTSAVLGLVLSSATYDAVDTTPDVIFTVSEDPYLLYHGGGDILYKNDLVFYAGGYDISDSISLENEGESWTEWHTGQAINTRNTGSNVSELTIVALDSRGNAYLVYNGPTADPIPSGKPVPDVTPKPTVTPTPSHLPDATFTWRVAIGSEVSPSSLPPGLTADAYVINDKVWILWPWWWDRYADVEFTAVENGADVIYLWSSPGADISYSTDKISEIRFNNPGLYSVTLTVTNSSGSNSSTKIFSVRNPGITAMTWIKYDGSGTRRDPPYFYVYNRSVGGSTNYKWWLNVEPTNNNYDKYNLKFNIGYDDDSVTDNKESLNIDVWYHLSGTFEETEGYNYLNVYFNGQNKDSDTTSDSPADYIGGTTKIASKHFDYNQTLVHDIPFALTEAEIITVYNAENLDGHT